SSPAVGCFIGGDCLALHATIRAGAGVPRARECRDRGHARRGKAARFVARCSDLAALGRLIFCWRRRSIRAASDAGRCRRARPSDPRDPMRRFALTLSLLSGVVLSGLTPAAQAAPVAGGKLKSGRAVNGTVSTPYGISYTLKVKRGEHVTV